MIYILQYRAHLPPRFTNLLTSSFNPLRGRVDFSVSYRALAYGTVNTETDSIPAGFLFEYDTSPFLRGDDESFLSFVKSLLTEEDFNIPDPKWKVYTFQPIAYYGAGFFFKGIHKTPGYKGLDLFFSTVPPEKEGKPWWGEYYDPAVRHLYNPPPEAAFAEDFRSYLYTGNPNDPRVVCPALIPSHLWERLRFFIRFFDTVYIFKPTEYARRRFYRLVEEEFPGWMRILQGLSWLKEVDIPKEAIGLPYTGMGVFLTVSLGENIGVWSWEEGGGEPGLGDEILPPPSYYPTALQSSTHILHLNRGKWKYSPNSGYWPPPPNPTWWDISGFSVAKVGHSLLHYLTYMQTEVTEEEWWRATLEDGAQVKVFASFSTGYRDSQGNWIMPPFVGAESPLLVWHGTSGDFILGNIPTDSEDAENKVIVQLRGQDVKTGKYGSVRYKIIYALTAVARIAFSSFERIRETAKVYAPPEPQEMARVLLPWMELEDVMSFPYRRFLQKEKRKLHYKPEDMNRHVRDIEPPTTVVTTGGRELLGGVSFHVATLPTGESSNVIAWSRDPNKTLTSNSFVDNISAELDETETGDSIRPWIDEHLLPVLQDAISYIKEGVKKRGYVGKVGVAHDMVCWQVKTLKGSPRDNLPISMTSEKETITLGDYCRRVGFSPTNFPPAEYQSKIKVFRRLHGLIPIGAFIVRNGEEIDLKTFLKQYADIDEMAKFPIEKSPKLVMWLGGKVSPPELQFIPAYRVLTAPPLGLLWEFVGRDRGARERKTWVWARLLEGETGDKEFYAYLGSNVRLLSIVEHDLAFFTYDVTDDVYYIERYAQPIILATPYYAAITETQVDISIFPEGLQVTQSIPVEFWLREDAATILSSILKRLAAKNLSLRDLDSDEEVQQLLVELSEAVREVTGQQVDGRVILSLLLRGQIYFSPRTLGASLVDSFPKFMGWRWLEKRVGEDAIPHQIDFSTLSQFQSELIDWDRKRAVRIVGGQILETTPVQAEGETSPNLAVYEIKASNRLVNKIFRELNPYIISQSPYLTLLNRRLAEENVLRSNFFLVGDERDKSISAYIVDPSTKAFVICPYLSVAPFIFPNIPQTEFCNPTYDLNDKDLLSLYNLMQSAAHVPSTLDEPNVCARMLLPSSLSPRYAWYTQFVGETITSVQGIPVPPHHLPDNKPKYYSLLEFKLQPLPLWLLRSYYTPADTFLRSLKATAKWEGIKKPVPFEIEYSLAGVGSEEKVIFSYNTLLDSAIVRKFKDEQPLPVVLSIPDSKEESGERLEVLYLPDPDAEEFYDAIYNDGGGYFIPLYGYDRVRDEIDHVAKDMRGLTRPRQTLPHLSPHAPEEMWLDGVKKVKVRGWDEERESIFLRLRYEHPFHPRIYLSIYTVGAATPTLLGVVRDGKVEFLASEWEPFNYFTLLRGTNPLAGSDRLHGRGFLQKFAKLVDTTIEDREERLFTNYWNRVRTDDGKILPTLQVLYDSFLSKVNDVAASLREVLKHLLELPSEEEWWDDDERNWAYTVLEKYVSHLADGVDYSPFCAYYAPAAPSVRQDIQLWNSWWEGKPLRIDERVPAALLVLPKPFGKFVVSTFSHGAWGGIEDTIASITHPALPQECHSFLQLDVFAFYPYLARQAARQRIRDILRSLGVDKVDIFFPAASSYPKLGQLERLRLSSEWGAILSHVDKVLDFHKSLAWGEIFTSAFYPPYYIPSFIEVVESIITTCHIFLDLLALPPNVDAPEEVRHWQELATNPPFVALNPAVAWSHALAEASSSPDLPAEVGAALALPKLGLSHLCGGAVVHPTIWISTVKGGLVATHIAKGNWHAIAPVFQYLREKVLDKEKRLEVSFVSPSWWGLGGFSAPTPPCGLNAIYTKLFSTNKGATAALFSSYTYPVFLDFQHAIYFINEVQRKTKHTHLRINYSAGLRGETNPSNKIESGITLPLGDVKFNSIFSLLFLLASDADHNFGEGWGVRLLPIIVFSSYYPYANVEGLFPPSVRLIHLGANRGGAIINSERFVPLYTFPNFSTTVGNLVIGVTERGFPSIAPVGSPAATELLEVAERGASFWSWWWDSGGNSTSTTLWAGVELSLRPILSNVLPIHPSILAPITFKDFVSDIDLLLSEGIEKEMKSFWGSLVTASHSGFSPPDLIFFFFPLWLALLAPYGWGDKELPSLNMLPIMLSEAKSGWGDFLRWLQSPTPASNVVFTIFAAALFGLLSSLHGREEG